MPKDALSVKGLTLLRGSEQSEGEHVRKLFTTRRRIGVVVATVVAVLTAGGVAFAYFTSTGSGTGQGSVGTSANWLVTFDTSQGTNGVSGGPIYPGSGTETLYFTVKNAGSGEQQYNLDGATMNTCGATVGCFGTATDATHNGTDIAGCSASWFTPHVATDPGKGQEFTPGEIWATDSTVTLTMPTNSTTDQSKCESAAPDVTFSVGP